jgi:hypothetical protein
MDVTTELVPKKRFLDKAGLSVFDMARFPQVFSYPLVSCVCGLVSVCRLVSKLRTQDFLKFLVTLWYPALD